jgi:hypothetical protein
MLACQFIFGEGSILTIQLQNFAVKIAKHNIVYKNQIARDDSFAGKNPLGCRQTGPTLP